MSYFLNSFVSAAWGRGGQQDHSNGQARPAVSACRDLGYLLLTKNASSRSDQQSARRAPLTSKSSASSACSYSGVTYKANKLTMLTFGQNPTLVWLSASFASSFTPLVSFQCRCMQPREQPKNHVLLPLCVTCCRCGAAYPLPRARYSLYAMDLVCLNLASVLAQRTSLATSITTHGAVRGQAGICSPSSLPRLFRQCR